MQILKAIERLETFVERHPSAGYSDLIPSLKLGIEALKRLQETRHIHRDTPHTPLPGETMEKGG